MRRSFLYAVHVGNFVPTALACAAATALATAVSPAQAQSSPTTSDATLPALPAGKASDLSAGSWICVVGVSPERTAAVTQGATANTPPVPVIDTPQSTVTWAAGDTVSFSGHATDTQDGTVRAYVNPQGTAFQPIQDTSAFATCP